MVKNPRLTDEKYPLSEEPILELDFDRRFRCECVTFIYSASLFFFVCLCVSSLSHILVKSETFVIHIQLCDALAETHTLQISLLSSRIEDHL